jgi:uncharacterized protein (TIGR02145 family)
LKHLSPATDLSVAASRPNGFFMIELVYSKLETTPGQVKKYMVINKTWQNNELFLIFWRYPAKMKKLHLFTFVLLPGTLVLNGQTPMKGTVVDIEGHVYRTVEIGPYEWMAENLMVKTYKNGTEIPHVAENYEWTGLNTGAWCRYENNESHASTYGLLYNWYAVQTEMLCPDGWRVPTDMEWSYLEGEVDSQFGVGDPAWYKPQLLRGFDAADKLKASEGWTSGGNGTDSFGFKALPGGERRVSDGNFFQVGRGGFWWSSTQDGVPNAWFRNMAYSFEQTARNTHDKRFGFSVRCLRNIE